MQWDRIEREISWGWPIVARDFDRQRASQHRGRAVLPPILAGFKMLTRYDSA
jgi:hypothetical protein